MYKSATPMKLNKITAAGFIISIIALAILFLPAQGLYAQNLLQYVQPLSGTAPSTTPAAVKHSEVGSEANANTIPAVTVPFAMTQFTAQTRQTENKCIPPYFYKDSLFSGVRATHWISGSCTQDYGSFTVVPVTGTLKKLAAAYSLPFKHADEITSPAYYKLLLPEVMVEITATARCGVIRFTMLQDDSLYLLINPNSDYGTCTAAVDAVANTVTATNAVHRIYQGWGNRAGFDGYAYCSVNKKIGVSGTYEGAAATDAQSIANKKNAGAYIGFYVKKGEAVELKVGTSFTGIEGAKNNLQQEVGNKNFDAVYAMARAVWQKTLQQINIITSNEKDKRVFYTALYHAMQHPGL